MRYLYAVQHPPKERRLKLVHSSFMSRPDSPCQPAWTTSPSMRQLQLVPPASRLTSADAAMLRQQMAYTASVKDLAELEHQRCRVK